MNNSKVTKKISIQIVFLSLIIAMFPLIAMAQTTEPDIGNITAQQQLTEASQKNQFTVNITYEKAIEIAISKVGGGTVKDIELDIEKGRLVYDIEVSYKGREYDVHVDAETGEIVKFKLDD